MAAVTRKEDAGHGGTRISALLLAATLLSAFAYMPALGAPPQQNDDTRLIAQAAAQRFAIPPQPLAGALIRFSRETGIELFFDDAIARGLASPGVAGVFTPQDALRRLLAGTGLTYRFTNDTTVTLERTGRVGGGVLALDPVRVEGEGETAWSRIDGYVATRSATGTKTDTPILETPRSISVVTAEQIEDQKSINIADALRYTPGLVPEVLGTDNRELTLQIRGFESTKAVYLDGLQAPSGNFTGVGPDAYLLERVELLRGPASVLYGQNELGGLVNTVTKRPPSAFIAEAEAQYGSFHQGSGRFDIGGPVDDGKEVLFRLTGLKRWGDSQIDFVEDQRTLIAPAFAWRPTRDTSFTFLSSYQKDKSGSLLQFLPASGTVLPNPNGTIPTNRFGGEPDFDSYENETSRLGYLLEHRIGGIWTLRHNLRYTHASVDYRTLWGFGLLGDDRTLFRAAIVDEETINALATDSSVQAKFALGPSAHTALAGIDYKTASFRQTEIIGAAPTIDIFDPVYGQPVQEPTFATALFAIDTDQTTRQVGVYLQDQVKLFDKVVLSLGGRKDWAKSETENKLTSITTKQSDDAFTGQVGLVYLFDNGLAPYVSYAESFNPETGTDFFGSPFKPTTGQQQEVGIKFEPKGYEALLSVAGFNLTKQNVLTDDPDPLHNGFSVQTGEVRTRGVEVEGRVRLFGGLGAIASYTYQDTRVTESNGSDLGNRPTQVPEHIASLWLFYTINDGPLAGLGAGAGARYIGTTYGDANNSYKVPAFAIGDAAIRYDWKNVRLGFNVKNILDKSYASACSNTDCFYGQRRTFTGSIAYRW